jgi:Ca2+-binding EF-hand superfamily protein
MTFGLGLLLALPLAVPAYADDAESRAQKQIRNMDTNRDKLVSLEEFTIHRRGWAAKQTDPEMRMQPDVVQRAFDRVDSNRDGSITYDELLASLRASKK